jgi:putative flippase GtrA
MTWREHLSDIWGAAGASFIATASDALVYMVLLWTLVESGTISVGIAAGCGALFGGLVHYSLSRFVVFRRFQAPVFRSAATYFPMSWLAAVLHGFATGGFSGLIDPKLAWFCSKGLIWMFWTYPMSRYVVFGGVGASNGDNGNESDDSRPQSRQRR